MRKAIQSRNSRFEETPCLTRLERRAFNAGRKGIGEMGFGFLHNLVVVYTPDLRRQQIRYIASPRNSCDNFFWQALFVQLSRANIRIQLLLATSVSNTSRAILCIESEVTQNPDFIDVISNFVNAKARKITTLISLQFCLHVRNYVIIIEAGNAVIRILEPLPVQHMLQTNPNM